MKRKNEKTRCVFHIAGGNNQILPNVTSVVQNFYGDCFGEAVLEAGPLGAGKVPAPLTEDKENKESDKVIIAKGELRIYYPDKSLLQAIVIRLSNCKDAADLANLVVNDMMEHTILNEDIVTKSHFIKTLQELTCFTKGSSVSNIRQQIRKQVMLPHKKGEGK